jgi:hypothetical protein
MHDDAVELCTGTISGSTVEQGDAPASSGGDGD